MIVNTQTQPHPIQTIVSVTSQTSEMFNFQSFAEVFAFDPECSYDENTVSTIEGNRKDMEGLFIDRVMKATGIVRRKELFPLFVDWNANYLSSCQTLPSQVEQCSEDIAQEHHRKLRSRPYQDLYPLLPTAHIRLSYRQERLLDGVGAEYFLAPEVSNLYEGTMAHGQKGVRGRLLYGKTQGKC